MDMPASHHSYYEERYVRYPYAPRHGYCPHPPPYSRFRRRRHAASRKTRRSLSMTPSSGHSRSSGSEEDDVERCIDHALVGGGNAGEEAPISPESTMHAQEPKTLADTTVRDTHVDEDDVPLSQVFNTHSTKEPAGGRVSFHPKLYYKFNAILLGPTGTDM